MRTSPSRILATDLDGTLIPFEDAPRQAEDLARLGRELAARSVTLVFVTGRHLALAQSAIHRKRLPAPHWLIADVGTSIYAGGAAAFAPVEAYQAHLRDVCAGLPRDALQRELASVGGIRLQEPEKQGAFKLSYYADATALAALVDGLQERLTRLGAPWTLIDSVDPFNGDGLIDLLPAGVSKSHALAWWVDHVGASPESIVFAGDSGNDLAALTAGYRAVVVGNADRRLAANVFSSHRDRGWRGRVYFARESATSGVLEGCRWFGLIPPASPSPGSTARLGAIPITSDTTDVCVWAPDCHTAEVERTDTDPPERHTLVARDNGYFTGRIAGLGPDGRYWYRLDGRPGRPDPASRFQPDGVHGPSQVIDPQAFPWTDHGWHGIAKRDLVIYELHVGAFTQEGTFRAAIARLDELVELGITAVELMPVAQSPGRWNWGYDGVGLFATYNAYGSPDDLRALVDACHDRGLALLLDVVYNHLGPEGNYLAEFGPYFSRTHRTGWGEAFNYDEPGSTQVRRFILDNARYWLEEYHVDGLRLDAIYFAFDDSEQTILDDLARVVSDLGRDRGRTIHLIAESNMYDHALLEPRRSTPAYDAIWCDCIMHSIYTHALPALQPPGRSYHGATDLALALHRGWVYAGSDATRVPATADKAVGHLESLVIAVQNHDRVGSHPRGLRLHQLTSLAFQRAAAALVLLYPSIPLLFMGEESAVDAPFPFFVDFRDERLRAAVREGRERDFPASDVTPLCPTEPETFSMAKCGDPAQQNRAMRAWYRDLLVLRRRGIAEGWLAAPNLTTDYDAEHAVFSLAYSREGHGPVVVRARLSGAVAAQVAPVAVAHTGQLLLSSEPLPPTSAGSIALELDHAVVTG